MAGGNGRTSEGRVGPTVESNGTSQDQPSEIITRCAYRQTFASPKPEDLTQMV